MQEVSVPTFVEDKSIISLATIQSTLGNQFRITGLGSPAEASELALLLRAGGLAAPMHFAEERTIRSEEHTSELQSRPHLVCRLLLEKKKDDQGERPTVFCL